MSFAVGVYDLFAYSIPGAIYLALAGYLGERADWFDRDEIDLGSLSGLLAFVVVAYFVGQLAYRPAQRLSWAIRGTGATSAAARGEFRQENAAIASRPFVAADHFLLLAAVQKHNPEAAADIAKFRAAGIMLRTATPAFVAGTVAALVEVVVGDQSRTAATVAAVVFALGAYLAFEGDLRLRMWSIKTTLQAACWIPGVDDVVLGVSTASTADLDPDDLGDDDSQ